MSKRVYRVFAAFLMCMFLINAAIMPEGWAVVNAAKSGKKSVKDEYAQDRVIVKYKKGTKEKDKELLKHNLNLHLVKKYSLIDGELVKIKDKDKVEDIIEKLKKDKSVEYAEPDYILKADASVNDPSFSQLWGLQNISDIDIDAPEAWNITQGSKNIIVGVLDEGMDINHPDLAQNIWTNSGEIPGDGIDNDGNGYIDDVHGWDFCHNDNTVFDPSDGDDHGTHVAGTIAAISNNAVGVAGVAPNVKLMPLKFLGRGGEGYTSDAVSALEYAKKMGIKLTSNSWGSAYNSTTLHDTINSFNGVFVCAAGNNGVSNDTSPHYPAAYDCSNIISVASIDSSGSLSYFSNYGAVSVDVGAPGDSILSTTPDSSYGYMSGTSMATPHVSGVAALILSLNPNLSSGQVCDIIKQSAAPLNSLQGKTVTGGLVNAYNAVTLVKGLGPYVTSSSISNYAKEVPIDSSITLTFNEAILQGDNYSNIKLIADVGEVPLSCRINENTLNITPSGLINDKNYILSIPSGAVKNSNNEQIKFDYNLHFSTPDTIAPVIVNTDPINGESNVYIYKTIYVNFSEEIKAGQNLNDITINGSPLGQYGISISGSKLMINYYSRFNYSSTYKVFIPQDAVEDIKGNGLKDPYSFSFITEADTLPPDIYYTNPYDGSTDVSANTQISIKFNESIKEGTNFNDINLLLNDVPVQINRYINKDILNITPVGGLQKGSNYKFVVPAGSISDIAGNAIKDDISFIFTTSIYDIAEFSEFASDAVLSPNSPTVYMISEYHGKLISYNYETKTTKIVDLGYMPKCIEAGKGQYADEIYIGLGGQVPTSGNQLVESYSPQSIAVLDSTDLTIKDSIALGFEPHDIVADNSGYIYAIPDDGQFASIVSYNRTSKEKASESGIKQASFAKYNSVLDRIYTIDTESTTRGYNAYNVANGIFTDPSGGYASPDYGKYPLDTNFSIDPTGKYLFNGSDAIFSAAQDKTQDMKYVSRLNTAFNDIAFAPDLSSFYTVTYDKYINVYNGMDFSLRETIPIGGSGRYIFEQGNKLVVLLNQANKMNPTGLQVVNIPDDPPSVLKTSPAMNAVNVANNAEINITFSENIQAGNAYDSITLKDNNGETVSIEKTITGNVLSITPNVLKYSTLYTITIPKSSIEDMKENALAGDIISSFTTMAAPDNTSPQVVTTNPLNGAKDTKIDQVINIDFDEDISGGSNYSGIVLRDGNNNTVNITSSISGKELIISHVRLNYSTTYTLAIPSDAIKDSAGNLASGYTLSFTTMAEPDNTPPQVATTNPLNGAKNIDINQVININFNEDIFSVSNYSGIVLKDGNNNTVNTTSSISGKELIIGHASLNYSTTYTLTIPSDAIKDSAGNLAGGYTLSFATMAEPDNTPPQVTTTNPLNGAEDMEINQAINIDFNEDISIGSNYSGIVLKDGNNNTVNTISSILGKELIIEHALLNYSMTYTLTIPSDAIKDSAGNLAGSYTLSFTTMAAPDKIAPIVTESKPAKSETGVSIKTQTIVITFSEEIKEGTKWSLIMLKKGSALADFSVSISGKQLILTPKSTLYTRSTYTVYIPADAVQDLTGNPLASAYTFSFTTGKK